MQRCGGPMVKTPVFNAEKTNSIPGQGTRSHMLRGVAKKKRETNLALWIEYNSTYFDI